MPESAQLRAPTHSGGISKLNAEVQSPGQVKDALNVDFSLQRGMDKRAGTRHLAALGTALPASVWLMSKTLEGGDRPRVMVGSDGSVRVLSQAAAELTVQIDPRAAAYLAAAAGKRPNAAMVDDGDGVLRISNPAIVPAAQRSAAVKSLGFRQAYDALECFTPAQPGGIYEAKEAADGRPAGLYRYLPGTGTFAVAQFAAYDAGGATGTPTIRFNDASENPRGFRLFACRYMYNSAVAVYAISATAGGNIGTITGIALPGYTFQPGDQVYYSAGGGGTPGAYNIAAWSGGVLFLEGVITGAAAGNITIQGIGRMVEVVEDFNLNPAATMDEAAVRLTNALRRAGLPDTCVHWDWTDFPNYIGKFSIACPWGGPKAGFRTGFTVFAPTTAAPAVQNDTAATKAFNAPTITAGTGAFDDFTTDPRDRWEAVTAPDQSDAVFDASKMPVRVRKVDSSSYRATTLDLGAWHYWRLGDDSNNTSAKDSAGHSLGSYVNAPARAIAGLLTGDTDTSTTFDGVNDHVLVTTWQALGNASAITVEMLAKTTTAAVGERCLFHMRQTNDLYVTMNKTAANRITVYAGGGESYCDVANFNDGNLKHIAVVCTSTSIRVEINGAAQLMVVNAAVTGNPGIAAEGTAYTIRIGSRIDNSQFFAGTLDEVAVYPFAFSAATVTSQSTAKWRHLQATGTTTELWAVELSPWESRTTGNSDTNPVPSFVTNGQGISAMTVWQDRGMYGAGRTVSMTRKGENANLFVRDTSVVTDADPIDWVVADAESSVINGLTVFDSICVATTSGSTQYELSAAGALTPTTLNSRAGYRQKVADVQPAMSGDRLYLVGRTSQVDGASATLLEGIVSDQAVQASYDDVGQQFRGALNPSSLDNLDLATIASDGKVILCERGGSRLWVYQTAYVGGEKRQSAWSIWSLGTGIIHAACDEGESVLLVVERSGKYSLESWTPEPDSLWPAAAHRMDGRLSLVGGAFALGVTTFTMPTNVPATGVTNVVKADGTIYAATPISATQFTVAANLNGITVTVGRDFEAWGDEPKPFARDLNGVAVVSTLVTPAFLVMTGNDVTKLRCIVTIDSRAPQDFPVRPIRADNAKGRAFTRGPAGRTNVRLSLTGVAPVWIGAVETIVDAQGARR